jgi:predicted dienelactone hydrolase
MKAWYRNCWSLLGMVGTVAASSFAIAEIAQVAQAKPLEVFAGVRSAQVQAPQRGQAIDITYWYPATNGGSAERVGASAVFLGTPALRDAPVAQGRFPLVILSHGGLRAARYTGAWLAADLAKRGYWVVQVHAPALRPSDAPMAHREAWLRPADLSAAITAARQDPLVAQHTTGPGVAVVGLLRGGASALSLAGARLDPQRYARLCDEPAERAAPDCSWFQKQGVAWRAVESEAVGQSHLDARVRVAVVITPELGRAFSAASVASVAFPVHFISLGRRGTMPSFLDASDVVQNIPGATHQTLVQAHVFSIFDHCTTKGASLLKEEGENPLLCEEPREQSRHALHAELVALIHAALRPSMGSPHN